MEPVNLFDLAAKQSQWLSVRQSAIAGNIANTTKFLAFNASNPKLAPFARAAKESWFVPTSPNWANVENANVLQNMLVKIFTGRASVKAAATSASSQITRILNTGA